MILHLSPDDKFIDHFIAVWDSISTIENKYLIYTPNDKLKYVKSQNVHFANPIRPEFRDTIGNLGSYRAIFFHYFTAEISNIADSAPPHVKLVWCFWGAEAFGLSKFDKHLYQPETKKLLKEQNIINSKWLTANPKWLYKNLRNRYLKSRAERQYIKSLRKINYFAHFIYDDYLLVKRKLKLKAEYIEFNYGHINSYVSSNIKSDIAKSQNFLLGNSASAANNHLDGIKYLSKNEIGNRKVFVPLSYSSPSDIYVEKVILEGKKKLKENFIPITTFLSKDEYNAIIDTCNILLMNHYRSQAGANILIGLATGKKVFMSSRSNMYKFFKKLGIHLFSIESDFYHKNLAALEQKPAALNKKIIDDYFSQDAVQLKYKKMFQKVFL